MKALNCDNYHSYTLQSNKFSESNQGRLNTIGQRTLSSSSDLLYIVSYIMISKCLLNFSVDSNDLSDILTRNFNFHLKNNL